MEALPRRLHALIEEVFVVVDDAPDESLLRELIREWGIEDTPDQRRVLADEMCGLHTGVPITDRSVMAGVELPEVIQLFRRGIVSEAGGWAGPDAEARVHEQIEVTLLHEIGHHFGLDEEDLAELGYD